MSRRDVLDVCMQIALVGLPAWMPVRVEERREDTCTTSSRRLRCRSAAVDVPISGLVWRNATGLETATKGSKYTKRRSRKKMQNRSRCLEM
ncbi:hypothetical protein GJ744_003282 [Endocarpon pusillum]|uniref:Uncharacterized protein n=1 Tax=Endocarpon pusillum TaxID=364733 RepID=A0A8H7A6Z9_9EURO|nr:hypothetical protein GJ744_003282 [Endocarpon pusillum]